MSARPQEWNGLHSGFLPLQKLSRASEDSKISRRIKAAYVTLTPHDRTGSGRRCCADVIHW